MSLAVSLDRFVVPVDDLVAAYQGPIVSRKVPGPHIAFYVPAAKWRDALAHLDALGVANGDRGAAKERRDGQGGTDMDDPAGYVIQYITDGIE